MKQEFKKDIIICDNCKIQVLERFIFRNDGSYQKDYITLHGKDVCHRCSLEILDKLSTHITKDMIEEVIK